MEKYRPDHDHAYAPQIDYILNGNPRPTPIAPAAATSPVGVLDATAARNADVAAWDNESHEMFRILFSATTSYRSSE